MLWNFASFRMNNSKLDFHTDLFNLITLSVWLVAGWYVFLLNWGGSHELPVCTTNPSHCLNFVHCQ